jgi:hypothetical protein
MQLSRLFAVLLIFVSASACSDSTAPLLRAYTLTAVDGHPLPFTSFGIDAGSRLLWGNLYLDETGHAFKFDHYRYFGAILPADSSEETQRQDASYTIANDSITLELHRPLSGNDVGAFSDSVVTLTFDVSPRTGPVYTYRLVRAF